MWIVWMSQNGDEGPKNPSVSYQIQPLLVVFNKNVPPTSSDFDSAQVLDWPFDTPAAR